MDGDGSSAEVSKGESGDGAGSMNAGRVTAGTGAATAGLGGPKTLPRPVPVASARRTARLVGRCSFLIRLINVSLDASLKVSTTPRPSSATASTNGRSPKPSD